MNEKPTHIFEAFDALNKMIKLLPLGGASPKLASMFLKEYDKQEKIIKKNEGDKS